MRVFQLSLVCNIAINKSIFLRRAWPPNHFAEMLSPWGLRHFPVWCCKSTGSYRTERENGKLAI